MLDPILNSTTMNALKSSLNGLSTQQEVIGQNLANVDTPGYRSQKVDFKTALKRAVDGTSRIALKGTHAAHIGTTNNVDRVQIGLRKGGTSRADGNNVDIDVELSQMTETVVEFQALSQLISKKFAGIKMIITGR